MLSAALLSTATLHLFLLAHLLALLLE